MVSRSSRRIWELSHQSVDQLVALLKRLRIRCDLKTRDAVYYATSAHAAERLRRECELRARSGFDAEWLGPGALRRLTGIAGHGAILSRGSAQFDPYRACVGILRAAAAAGAQVFERSEVRRIERAHNRVRIRTRQGTLRRRPRGHRDRLRNASVSAVGGTISDVSDVRPGDRADRQFPTRRRRSVRRHGLGHRAALPLCSLDTGASTPPGRRGPPGTARSTASSTVRDSITRSTGVLRNPTACVWQRSEPNVRGKACSR